MINNKPFPALILFIAHIRTKINDRGRRAKLKLQQVFAGERIKLFSQSAEAGITTLPVTFVGKG